MAKPTKKIQKQMNVLIQTFMQNQKNYYEIRQFLVGEYHGTVSADDGVKANEYDTPEPGVGGSLLNYLIIKFNVHKNIEILELMMNYGADANQKFSDGSAFDVNKQHNKQEPEYEHINAILQKKPYLSKEANDDFIAMLKNVESAHKSEPDLRSIERQLQKTMDLDFAIRINPDQYKDEQTGLTPLMLMVKLYDGFISSDNKTFTKRENKQIVDTRELIRTFLIYDADTDQVDAYINEHGKDSVHQDVVKFIDEYKQRKANRLKESGAKVIPSAVILNANANGSDNEWQ